MRTTTAVTCKHPDRKHQAKGLCHSCYTTAYEKTVTPEKKKLNTRRRNIRAHHDMSLAEYAEFFERQGSRCAICSTTVDPYQDRPLSIDHNHATLLKRGLLCTTCNLRLGILEDLLFLVGALSYLAERDPEGLAKILALLSRFV